MSDTEFSGLTMPVFTAFGWAGEEAAINYALSQLDGFARALHEALAENITAYMPFFGLDKGNQVSYIAVERDHESGPFFSFIDDLRAAAECHKPQGHWRHPVCGRKGCGWLV